MGDNYMNAKHILNFFITLLSVGFILILITKPEICRDGAISGILLCGRVIIPSLFPFVMCIMYIVNSGILNSFEKLSVFKRQKKPFSTELCFIVILSFIGGYPIGAKLLNNSVVMGRISAKKAGNMLNYCINAGPAFIVSAIGSGILGSKELGIILLLSHIFAGVILILISNHKNDYSHNEIENKINRINPADNFVKSVADASATVLSICSFVILFSAVNAYIQFFSQNSAVLRTLGLVLEITNGVAIAKNIYIIAFLLGFGGISVWCQILSVSNNIAVNFNKFIIFRFLHGTLSVVFTAIFLKFLGSELYVFSNIKTPIFSYFHSSGAIGFSLLILDIVFIISVSTKKYVGKITEDMI